MLKIRIRLIVLFAFSTIIGGCSVGHEEVAPKPTIGGVVWGSYDSVDHLKSVASTIAVVRVTGQAAEHAWSPPEGKPILTYFSYDVVVVETIKGRIPDHQEIRVRKGIEGSSEWAVGDTLLVFLVNDSPAGYMPAAGDIAVGRVVEGQVFPLSEDAPADMASSLEALRDRLTS